MRVRLWLKSTRISVATCQKERIVRRYLSLHWGAGAMPRKETWHGHEERSASCNITIKAFPTPRALTKRPYESPYENSLLTFPPTKKPTLVGSLTIQH